MAYVSTFMYSESIQNENGPNQKPVIVGPQIVFRPLFVPCLFSFAVTFGLLDLDVTKPQKFRYVFRSPNPHEESLVDTGYIEIPSNMADSELPEDMRGIIMNMDFRNVPFRQNGEYYSDIYVNGTLLGTFPIKVRGRE